MEYEISPHNQTTHINCKQLFIEIKFHELRYWFLSILHGKQTSSGYFQWLISFSKLLQARLVSLRRLLDWAWSSDYFGCLSPNLYCSFKHFPLKWVIFCLLAAQIWLDLLAIKVQANCVHFCESDHSVIPQSCKNCFKCFGNWVCRLKPTMQKTVP